MENIDLLDVAGYRGKSLAPIEDPFGPTVWPMSSESSVTPVTGMNLGNWSGRLDRTSDPLRPRQVERSIRCGLLARLVGRDADWRFRSTDALRNEQGAAPRAVINAPDAAPSALALGPRRLDALDPQDPPRRADRGERRHHHGHGHRQPACRPDAGSHNSKRPDREQRLIGPIAP
jgi:hypothetical protein